MSARSSFVSRLLDKARGTAAGATPKNQGGPEPRNRPERHLPMLQDSMVLPTKNGKSAPPSTLFSSANVAKARRAEAWFDSMVARAKKEGVIVEVGNLTPELAELLLARNPDNRNVSNLAVARYGTDTKNGDWVQNGETIKVSTEGLLNDGQHRALMAVATGCTIPAIWVFGLKRDTRYTVDQNKPKTSGDYLSMEGVAYSNNVATVANFLWQYEKMGEITRTPERRPTKTQVRETFHANPGIIDSIGEIPLKGSGNAGGLSTLAFCHYVLAKISRVDADVFIRQIVQGDKLSMRSPIYICRERLHAERKSGDRRMPAAAKIELIFRAWNAYRKGSRPTKFSVTGSLPILER